MLSRFKKKDKTGSLLRAARAGNVEKLTGLLNRKLDVNISDESGLTALHLASKEGHVNIVRELIKRGAKVDSQTKKKSTPLHISCLAGKIEVARLLVEGGANINAQSQNGFTPLYMASQEGHIDIVRYLLANRADHTLTTDDGYNPLSIALQQGHGDVVVLLMELGTAKKHNLSALHVAAKTNDVKAATLLLQKQETLVDCNRVTRSGFTPLHIACHYGNVDIGLLLLQKKADVNVKARNGITALHVASKRGHLEMVKLLTGSGAELDAKTMDGVTALHCAAKSGHHHVIRHLIEMGAKVNSKTRHGLTPLHNSTQSDSVESCKVLLNNKANINEGTVDNLTPLHIAAHFSNVKTGRVLLEKRCDVDARTITGFTPLHVAIKKNKPRMIELLLRYGANPDLQTATGLSALHLAALTGNFNVAAHVLQAVGVNVDCRTSRGDTPLHLATRNNHLDVANVLLHSGAQVDIKGGDHRLTPLHIASQLGYSDCTSLLLKHGSSPDSKTSEMMTPLLLAASKNSRDCVGHLIDHGANPDVANKSGYTPLHTAVKYDSLDVTRLLIERGVTTEIEGANGLKPLHVATHYNHIGCLQLLLDSGAKVDCRAHNGYTPLHLAAQENRINAANILIAHGADVNAVSKMKVSPLHIACREGHYSLVKLLLDKGAHVTDTTSSSLTPMHYAAIGRKPEVAELLRSAGAEVTIRDDNGNTPLHLACYHGNSDMVSYLLKNGADPNVTNKLGMTPLHYATQNGDLQSTNQLLNSGADPNSLSDDGWSTLCIAQRNGYGELAALLLPLTTSDRCLLPPDVHLGEEGEGGIFREPFIFHSPYPRPKVFISTDQATDSQGVKEMPIDFDDNDLFELDKMDKKSSVTSLGPGATDDELKYLREGEEACFISPAELTSTAVRPTSPAIRPISSLSSRPNSPSFNNFLVSFMVDARGGSMFGQRHSGVSVLVPPGCASAPVRVTCRYLPPEKVRHTPLLPEGEDLACRVIEVGPAGHQFLGPVTLKVPHYASLRGGAREITVLRSDDGKFWTAHQPPDHDALLCDANLLLPEDAFAVEKQHVAIVTDRFPTYFALVSRPRSQQETVSWEGGLLTSPVIHDVQVVVPQGAVKRDTQVYLQVIDVPDEMVDFEFGGKARVSPIVTLEPRRRKFHAPVTVKIPLPKLKSGDELFMKTRLLCSTSSDKMTTKWEDITDRSPLTVMGDCAAFLTSISARYWLVNIKQPGENWVEKASLVQQEASAVPFLAQFVVLGRRANQHEGNFKIFCVTEDRADRIKDSRRNVDFEEVARSQEVEVLEGKPLYLDIEGDLRPTKKRQTDLQSLIFHSFRENRLPVRAKSTDEYYRSLSSGLVPQVPRGKFIFHRTPKHLTPLTQEPICLLDVYMPEGDLRGFDFSVVEDGLESSVTGLRQEEHISKAELRLTDIADALDTDWIPLALQLGLSPSDVAAIQSDYDFLPEQALVMLHTWVQRNKDRATGNSLEKALKQIKREDVLGRCMYNIRQVTDVKEMAVAKEYLDSGDARNYLGSGADMASSRGSSVQRGVSLDRSYGEHASFRDASLFDSGSESASLHGKDDFGKEKIFKSVKNGDRFIYMDGSKSPSNLTVTPSESDVEFMPTTDICDLDAGIEYELEEVWDGTRWKFVKNVTPNKTKGEKVPSREDLNKRTEPIPTIFTLVTTSGASTATKEVTSSHSNVIVDEPDDVKVKSQAVFRSKKAPLVMDITDGAGVLMVDSTEGLTNVEENKRHAIAEEEEDEREKTPIIEVLEDQEHKKTITESREERLENGTTLRYKTQTLQTVRPVVEKYFRDGRWHEERKEAIIGEEIEDEILELSPGVSIEHGTDLESETTVEEFNETLPNGVWVKKKVTRIKVTRKKAPTHTIMSPWGEELFTSDGALRKSNIATPTVTAAITTDVPVKVSESAVTMAPTTAEVEQMVVVAKKAAVVPSEKVEMSTQSTDAAEKTLVGTIIETPEIVEHQEVLADGTLLKYKTITKRITRPVTRRIVRDGSIIETVTEQELVETQVEKEITEVSPGALKSPKRTEKSVISVEEFEERLPDNTILKSKVIRTNLKELSIDVTSTTTTTTAVDNRESFIRDSEHVAELSFDVCAEDLKIKASDEQMRVALIRRDQQKFTEKVSPSTEVVATQASQQDVTFTFAGMQETRPDVLVFEKAGNQQIQLLPTVKEQPLAASETKIAAAVTEACPIVERPQQFVEHPAQQQQLQHHKTVAITELTSEEETVSILTPMAVTTIAQPVTAHGVHKPVSPHDKSTARNEQIATARKAPPSLNIEPTPLSQLTATVSPPMSPTSATYELPPITETLGVQEWEDVRSDGTRQCFKIVTKRKMRPIAVMRPAMDGKGFIEKIIRKEKIGVEIDEEITEIAPNVNLDDEDDLDKTTSIDEFQEMAGDGTWVKRKVRRTEIRRSEDVEECASESSESAADLCMAEHQEMFDIETAELQQTKKQTVFAEQSIGAVEPHLVSFEQAAFYTKMLESGGPVAKPRLKKQVLTSRDEDGIQAHQQHVPHPADLTSSSQLHCFSDNNIEEAIDPVLGKIVVVQFADHPRVDEREETDPNGGLLRYKILTRNFKRRIFQRCVDGSERFVREENVGTEVEEHIEETQAGLKGDDEIGAKRKTTEETFEETMADGTWLKRKVTHAKIYRSYSDDQPAQQQLPTPVRSADSFNFHQQQQQHRLKTVGELQRESTTLLQQESQSGKTNIDEREESSPDGGKIKFKVTSRDHVIKVGDAWKKIGTEVIEEVTEFGHHVLSEDEEGVERSVETSESQDLLPDGLWIRRKVIRVRLTKKQQPQVFKGTSDHFKAQQHIVEQQQQTLYQQPHIVRQQRHIEGIQLAEHEFTETVNVEEHEEFREDGGVTTFKKVTKKVLKPVVETKMQGKNTVEGVAKEVELGTYVLIDTVVYEPGLSPDYRDYTKEEMDKVELAAMSQLKCETLPNNTYLKTNFMKTTVGWRRQLPESNSSSLNIASSKSGFQESATSGREKPLQQANAQSSDSDKTSTGQEVLIQEKKKSYSSLSMRAPENLIKVSSDYKQVERPSGGYGGVTIKPDGHATAEATTVATDESPKFRDADDAAATTVIPAVHTTTLCQRQPGKIQPDELSFERKTDVMSSEEQMNVENAGSLKMRKEGVQETDLDDILAQIAESKEETSESKIKTVETTVSDSKTSVGLEDLKQESKGVVETRIVAADVEVLKLDVETFQNIVNSTGTRVETAEAAAVKQNEVEEIVEKAVDKPRFFDIQIEPLCIVVEKSGENVEAEQIKIDKSKPIDITVEETVFVDARLIPAEYIIDEMEIAKKDVKENVFVAARVDKTLETKESHLQQNKTARVDVEFIEDFSDRPRFVDETTKSVESIEKSVEKFKVEDRKDATEVNAPIKVEKYEQTEKSEAKHVEAGVTIKKPDVKVEKIISETVESVENIKSVEKAVTEMKIDEKKIGSTVTEEIKTVEAPIESTKVLEKRSAEDSGRKSLVVDEVREELVQLEETIVESNVESAVSVDKTKVSETNFETVVEPAKSETLKVEHKIEKKIVEVAKAIAGVESHFEEVKPIESNVLETKSEISEFNATVVKNLETSAKKCVEQKVDSTKVEQIRAEETKLLETNIEKLADVVKQKIVEEVIATRVEATKVVETAKPDDVAAAKVVTTTVEAVSGENSTVEQTNVEAKSIVDVEKLEVIESKDVSMENVKTSYGVSPIFSKLLQLSAETLIEAQPSTTVPPTGDSAVAFDSLPDFQPVKESAESAQLFEPTHVRPHFDYPAPDLSPVTTEKEFDFSLGKDRLEAYERALKSVEEVIEGTEVIGEKAPLALLQAVLSQKVTEESVGKEEMETATVVEKEEATPMSSLLDLFLSRTTIQSSVDTVSQGQKKEASDSQTLAKKNKEATSEAIESLAKSLTDSLTASLLTGLQNVGSLLPTTTVSTTASTIDTSPATEIAMDDQKHDANENEAKQILDSLTESVVSHLEKKTSIPKNSDAVTTSSAAGTTLTTETTILSTSIAGDQTTITTPETSTTETTRFVETEPVLVGKEVAVEATFEKISTTTTESIEETANKKVEHHVDVKRVVEKEIEKTGESVAATEATQVDFAVTEKMDTETEKIACAKETTYFKEKKFQETEVVEKKVQEAEVVEKKVQEAEVVEKKVQEAEVVEKKVQEAEVVEKKVQEAEVVEKKVEKVEVDKKKVQETEAVEKKLEKAEVVEKKIEETEVVEKKVEETEVIEKKVEETDMKRNLDSMEVSSVNVETAKGVDLTKVADNKICIQPLEIAAEITEVVQRELSVESGASATVVDTTTTTVATTLTTPTTVVTTIDTTTTVSTTVTNGGTSFISTDSFQQSKSSIPQTIFTGTEAHMAQTTTTTIGTVFEKSDEADKTSPVAELPQSSEAGVTYQDVEGDVNCKIEETERHDISADGKKSITRKIMTRKYYQTHIRNKIKDGIIVAVEPVETYVGKCIDECVFESATDISDPYSADVETTTSIDEFEETLDDGTWVKKKVTTVVAYLAHEDIDSPSIFLDSLTISKSPAVSGVEQGDLHTEIMETLGSKLMEFFQETQNVENVKQRIVRVSDSKPKITEARKMETVKTSSKQSSKHEQQTSSAASASATTTETTTSKSTSSNKTTTQKEKKSSKREGKPPSFVLPELRPTRATSVKSQPEGTSAAASDKGSKKFVRSRVRRLITRKIRKVLHTGEVVEDIVTEEIPDVEMSETSSIRSGHSDVLDFMSPMSSSIASPSDLASPRRRKGSVSSHSSLHVYTDTVEGEPEVTTDVQEREETLPDGRVIVRKVIKTRQKQTIVKRVVLENAEDESGDPDIAALIGEDDPALRMYADVLLQDGGHGGDTTRKSASGHSYVDEWLQQSAAATRETQQFVGGSEALTSGPVVVSRIHSATSTRPKYRVSMERMDDSSATVRTTTGDLKLSAQ